jgi:ABC-type nitrate/sulfonate/bicarbonate transport system permease component
MTEAAAPAGAKPSGPAARLLRSTTRLLPYLYAAVGVVTVWWAVVLIAKPHMSLLPSPLLTAQTFVQLVASGELLSHAA